MNTGSQQDSNSQSGTDGVTKKWHMIGLYLDTLILGLMQKKELLYPSY